MTNPLPTASVERPRRLTVALLLPVIAVGLVHLATRSVSLRQLTSSPSDPTDGEEIT